LKISSNGVRWKISEALIYSHIHYQFNPLVKGGILEKNCKEKIVCKYIKKTLKLGNTLRNVEVKHLFKRIVENKKEE
jgi:hypothetical protein